MKTGATIDYVVLGVYFVILVGIGFYFSKMSKGGKDYFSGGNQLPWWVSGISLYMASFSAWTFTGAAGFVYQTEWFGILYFVIWSVGFFIGSPLTAGLWRRTRVISPVEYTRKRYNKFTQQVIGYVVVLNAVFSLGLTLTAVSKVIATTLNLPIELVIIVAGTAILMYTFLGGLWAVAIADVVQFIILIAITIIIFPLALNLVGGFDVLFSKLGNVQFEHVFKGEHYTFVWLFGVVAINILAAANAAQRYYSVKDEKAAKKVGILTGLLMISVPILFGLPPLVAKVLWPDLSQVPFFQGQSVPSETVFIAIVLKLLPNGLIGVFMAAMFAATLSTLDSMYNSTAAVVAKDLYGSVFKPNATDHQIMKFGKIATFFIGITTILTALVYSQSQFGIFNWMMIFASLFNIPMTVPLVYGLLFKNLKRWSGVTTIVFGLIIGIVEKFLLGWTFGIQILGTTVLCSLFILSSNNLGKIYLKNKFYSMAVSVITFAGFITMFLLFPMKALNPTETIIACVLAALFGIAIYFASVLFAKEDSDDRKEVDEFFTKLKTPIDLEKEVYSKGIKEVSTFPLIGKMTMMMGVLILSLAFFNMNFSEISITVTLSGVLILIGFLMYFFGKKVEKKAAATK